MWSVQIKFISSKPDQIPLNLIFYIVIMKQNLHVIK